MSKNNYPALKRGFGWKILNLWYIPVLVPLVVTAPFGILYTGLSVRNKRWIGMSFLTGAIMGVGTYLITSEISTRMGGAIVALNWIFSIIYMIANANDFLYLLDAKETEKEIFSSALEKISDDSNLSQNKLAADFIKDLHKWHREVESYKLKSNIQELIEVSAVVLKRNNRDSERFLERYGETLNKMLRQYDEIENTKLNTPEMRESMQNIENAMDKIVVAFKKEASSMYNNDIRDINAETMVFLQDLRNRGLLENDNDK